MRSEGIEPGAKSQEAQADACASVCNRLPLTFIQASGDIDDLHGLHTGGTTDV